LRKRARRSPARSTSIRLVRPLTVPRGIRDAQFVSFRLAKREQRPRDARLRLPAGSRRRGSPRSPRPPQSTGGGWLDR
jgi:hypothetical protein